MTKNKEIIINEVSYELIPGTIGEGGGGVIQLLKKEDKYFAYKKFKKGKRDTKKRFLSEIDFCKKNTHPNIIKVIDIAEKDEEISYLMPYFSKTLRDIINSNLEVNLLFDYIFKIANGIKFVHDKGVIHRDLKPENILIENDNLVIADFGIAHFKDSDLTKTNDLLANRNYLAPEQKKGNDSKKITNKADIFAFGAIIHECFVKENPTGTNWTKISEKYPSLEGMDDLINDMMNQNEAKRPTIKEVKIRLIKIKNNFQNNSNNFNRKLVELSKIELSQDKKEKIREMARQDVYFAKNIFYSNINRKININYNMQISYKVTGLLRNLFIQERVFSICQNKFFYESSNLPKDTNSSIDINKCEEHLELFREFQNIVEKYKIRENWIDLTNKIYKYFISCYEYHCRELINDIRSEIEDLENHLNDSPIMYITELMKYYIKENKENLKEFHFTDFFEINWDKLGYYQELEYKDKLYSDIFDDDRKILSILERELGISYFETQYEGIYQITFDDEAQFNNGKKFLLALFDKEEIFYHDLISIFDRRIYIDNLIEIKFDNHILSNIKKRMTS